MIPVVGVFQSRSDAESGAAQLRSAGLPADKINILVPHTTDKEVSAEVAKVPHVDGEQPGMAKTIGAVAGGATGFGVGEALATLLGPGIGPVLAIGVASGALIGALAGGKLGSLAENSVFSGLPTDELFLYKDTLRHGRTVLVAITADQEQAKVARDILERAGAESVDRAREMWWLGLRDVEKEHYEARGGNFQRDEEIYRQGFEAALQPQSQGKTYAQCRSELSRRYSDVWETEGFRNGFERGSTLSEATENGKQPLATKPELNKKALGAK
jgi:hypothetical protein